MIIFETRTPIWTSKQTLKCTSKVYKQITHKEEPERLNLIHINKTNYTNNTNIIKIIYDYASFM